MFTNTHLPLTTANERHSVEACIYFDFVLYYFKLA